MFAKSRFPPGNQARPDRVIQMEMGRALFISPKKVASHKPAVLSRPGGFRE